MESIQLNLEFTFPDAGLEAEELLAKVNENLPKTANVGLFSEVCRGKLIGIARDKFKANGDLRGVEFKAWLKDRDITLSQAHALIETADKAAGLLGKDLLAGTAKITKPALKRAVQASENAQKVLRDMIANAEMPVKAGDVRNACDAIDAKNADIFTDDFKAKIENGSIPIAKAAGLFRELDRLPEDHAKGYAEQIAASPNPVEEIKAITASAKAVATMYDLAGQVNAASGCDIDFIAEESIRLGAESTVAKVLKQARDVQTLAGKLYTAVKKLGSSADRLYVDTGATTPHTRGLIAALESLFSNGCIRVDLGDSPIMLQVIDSENGYQDIESANKEIAELRARLDDADSTKENAVANATTKQMQESADHWANEVKELNGKLTTLREEVTEACQNVQKLTTENTLLKQRIETMPAVSNHAIDPKVVTKLQEELTATRQENAKLLESLKTPTGLAKAWTANVAKMLNEVLAGERTGNEATAVARIVSVTTGVPFAKSSVESIPNWIAQQLAEMHPGFVEELQAIGV